MDKTANFPSKMTEFQGKFQSAAMSGVGFLGVKKGELTGLLRCKKLLLPSSELNRLRRCEATLLVAEDVFM